MLELSLLWTTVYEWYAGEQLLQIPSCMPTNQWVTHIAVSPSLADTPSLSRILKCEPCYCLRIPLFCFCLTIQLMFAHHICTSVNQMQRFLYWVNCQTVSLVVVRDISKQGHNLFIVIKTINSCPISLCSISAHSSCHAEFYRSALLNRETYPSIGLSCQGQLSWPTYRLIKLWTFIIFSHQSFKKTTKKVFTNKFME